MYGKEDMLLFAQVLLDMFSGELAVYMTKHLRNGDMVAVVRVLEWQRRVAATMLCLFVLLFVRFLAGRQLDGGAAALIASAIMAASIASVTRRLAKENEDLVEQVMSQ